MKTDYSHITLVVDRSGSMADIAKDAQGGINTFVKDQKAEPGTASFYLADFDTEHEDVYGPADIQGFKSYTLQPRGGTAMYDAIGKAIVKTGEFLAAKPEADRPSKVIFCIVTDGEENSSREWVADKVKAKITEHQDQYNWQFVFIGANIDAYQTGGGIGVRNTTQYASTGVSTRGVYDNVSQTVSAYRNAPTATFLATAAAVQADGTTAQVATKWADDTKSWVPVDLSEGATASRP